jgi:lipopolysaccharide export system permease protein
MKYNIKVNKKSGNNGNVLTGITIQKNLILVTVKTVIKAKEAD